MVKDILDRELPINKNVKINRRLFILFPDAESITFELGNDIWIDFTDNSSGEFQSYETYHSKEEFLDNIWINEEEFNRVKRLPKDNELFSLYPEVKTIYIWD